jgi:hypothetical protein
MFETNTVITIKLASGEELIAKYIKQTEDKDIVIEKPLAMMMSPQGLAFATFVPTMNHDGGVTLSKQNIVAVGKTLDKVAKEYVNATSPIKTAAKPNLII